MILWFIFLLKNFCGGNNNEGRGGGNGNNNDCRKQLIKIYQKVFDELLPFVEFLWDNSLGWLISPLLLTSLLESIIKLNSDKDADLEFYKKRLMERISVLLIRLYNYQSAGNMNTELVNNKIDTMIDILESLKTELEEL